MIEALISNAIPLAIEKISELNLDPAKSLYFTSEGPGALPWDVITLLRLLCLTNEDSRKWANVYEDKPISPKNEERVRKVLRESAKFMLSSPAMQVRSLFLASQIAPFFFILLT